MSIFRRNASRPKWLEIAWENDDGTFEDIRIYPGDTVTFANKNQHNHNLMRAEYRGNTLRLIPLCLMVEVTADHARQYADAKARRGTA